MNLFFYGTLRAEQVRQAVIGARHIQFKTGFAKLGGYQVFQVSGALYPMILKTNDHDIVSGLMMYDVDAEAVALLDRFEGIHYQRQQVTVETEYGAEQAEIYYPDSYMQPAGLWDFEQWAAHDMPRFFEKDFAADGVTTPDYADGKEGQ